MPSLSPGVSHPVALVPLTEENEDAMENRAFQKLLRTIGIRAPSDGQVGLGFVISYSRVLTYIVCCQKLSYWYNSDYLKTP